MNKANIMQESVADGVPSLYLQPVVGTHQITEYKGLVYFFSFNAVILKC